MARVVALEASVVEVEHEALPLAALMPGCQDSVFSAADVVAQHWGQDCWPAREPP